MKKQTLTAIFDKEPDSHPESILYQDGLTDYIEDLSLDGLPDKCSEENRLRIEAILEAHPSQGKILEALIDYEVSNGKGAIRQLEDNFAEISESIIKSLPSLEA